MSAPLIRLSPFVLLATCLAAAPPSYESELIFPAEKIHNHSSSIVQLANGDLFVCWYNGTGERTADDVKVEAARRPSGSKAWGPRYTIADTPGFPDTNPLLFFDAQQQLWVIWNTIIANRWETGLLKYKVTSRWQRDPIKWDDGDALLFIPRNFEAKVKEALAPRLNGRASGKELDEAEHALEKAGDKYFSRMGWMGRVHPLQLKSGRMLLPLYSDGYNFSLIAISDDGGKAWTTSDPLVSEGGVQPALVQRKDGAIAAYMRDNGPPPKRAMIAESKDDGVTWSPVRDSEIPNPGSSVDVVGLRDGSWLLILNDTERGRHSLAAWLSDDEGKTWKWKRHLELDKPEKGGGSFSYPSVMQSKDGLIHVTYSYSKDGQAIKHAQFNLDWVKKGD